MKTSTMPYVWLLSSILLLSFARAEDVKIRGFIYSVDSKPLASATVKLAAAHIQAVTDSLGKFLLTGTSVFAVKPHTLPEPTSRGRALRFTVQDQATPVRVDIFDLRGRRIFTPLDRKLEPGTYDFRPLKGLSGNSARGFYLVRLSIGSMVRQFRMLNITASPPGSAPLSSSISNRLSKTVAAAIDTILVSCPEFIDTRIEIDNYDQDLGMIKIAPVPEEALGRNIGNDALRIFPIDSTAFSGTTLTIDTTVDSIALSYSNDSLLGRPMRVLKTGSDKNGRVLLKFPIEKYDFARMNPITTYVEVQVGDVTVPIHGYFLKDTLVVTFHGIDSGMVVAPVLNPNMCATAFIDTTLIQGLNKSTKYTSEGWPTTHFLVYYDKILVYNLYHDFINSKYGAAENATAQFVQDSVVHYADAIAKIYRDTYKFNYPDLDLIRYPDLYQVRLFQGTPSSADKNLLLYGNSNKERASVFDLAWFPLIIVEPHGSGEQARKSDAQAGVQKLGLERVGQFRPEDNSDYLGSGKAAIAHEMMHAIFDGYDLWDDNTHSSFGIARGINEGIASTMGITLDYTLCKNQTEVIARNITSEVFLLDFPLMINEPGNASISPAYSNQDFFAYVARAYFSTDGLKYIADLLKAVHSSCKAAMPTSVIEYLGYMDEFFSAKVQKGLAAIYSDFVRQRAYEQSESSNVRDLDKSSSGSTTRFQLRKDRFGDPAGSIKEITQYDSPITFSSIPPFSSRAVQIKIPFTDGPVRWKISISHDDLLIGENNLMTALYPETDRTGSSSALINQETSEFIANDKTTATLLLMNTMKSEGKNVKVTVSKGTLCEDNVFLVSNPLLESVNIQKGPPSLCWNYDFFTYLGHSLFGLVVNSMSDELDAIKFPPDASDANKLKGYYEGLDAYLKAHSVNGAEQGLGFVYADFIRNRVYENNTASQLRAGDPAAAYTFRRDLFADPKGFADPNSNLRSLPQPVSLGASVAKNLVVFTEIPPYSTRAVKAFFNISIKTNKIIRACETPGLGDGKLVTVIYPERTFTWIRDKICLNKDTVFSTPEVDMATILLINASSETAKNVKVGLIEGLDDPYAISGCTDPMAINYNPLATVDDGTCLYYFFPLQVH